MYIRDSQLNGDSLDGWFEQGGRTFKFTYQPESPFLTVFELTGYEPGRGSNRTPVFTPFDGLATGVRRDVIRSADMHVVVKQTVLLRQAETRRAG